MERISRGRSALGMRGTRPGTSIVKAVGIRGLDELRRRPSTLRAATTFWAPRASIGLGRGGLLTRLPASHFLTRLAIFAAISAAKWCWADKFCVRDKGVGTRQGGDEGTGEGTGWRVHTTEPTHLGIVPSGREGAGEGGS